MYVPVQNPPMKGELLYSRDSIEIQNCREWMTAGLDLESLFDSSSTPHHGKTRCAEMSSCVGFENESKDSRPLDGQQTIPDELSDTLLPLNDPINSTLIQNFLSELQSHTSTPTPSSTTPNPEPDCEVPDSVFNSPPSPAVASSLGSPDTPLERTPSTSFTDPTDVPLLFSNFPDMSLLMQDVNPLLSMKVGEASQPLESAGGLEVSPLAPEGSAVDVTVMNSSNNVVDKQVLDLSDCVNFLDSTSYDPMMFLSSECTSSTTSSPPPPSNSTPLPSSPSPSTLTTNPPSPTTASSQTSLSFDFDFTAISQQDLATVVSKLSSTSPLLSPVNGNTDDTVPLSSRKRKTSSSFAEAGSPDTKAARTAETSGMGEEDRKKVRRDKNNKASQVSRARRKQRRKDQEQRAEELEEENAKLRVHVETLSTEIAELKKLLVNRLAQ